MSPKKNSLQQRAADREGRLKIGVAGANITDQRGALVRADPGKRFG